MAQVTLRKVVKKYDEVLAVRGIDLDITDKEFIVLVGPSGCGKSTTLRMIAGLEEISGGDIAIGGDVVNDVPPKDRDIAMVFQNYALYPHMNVYENMSFGLKLKKTPKAEIDRRVGAALAQVALIGLEARKPGQLSGGQQQRVALARALVVEPRVLLCDEPLGALDRKLRQQMQFELKDLQKRLGVTLVFVTHDQEEALAMSDRIAVMNKGRVEQVGTPTEIYEHPRTRFVADFIGEINLLDDGGRVRALRPEKIRLVPVASARLAGKIETANFLGGSTLYKVRSDDGRILLARETHVEARSPLQPGDAVGLHWNDGDAVLLEG